MHHTLLPLIALFVAAALLLIALALPLRRGRVKPNTMYGLRIRATFADEQVWYEANAASGRDLSWVGALTLVLALLLPGWPGIDSETYALVMGVVLAASCLLACLVGVRRARRLLAARQGLAPKGTGPLRSGS